MFPASVFKMFYHSFILTVFWSNFELQELQAKLNQTDINKLNKKSLLYLLWWTSAKWKTGHLEVIKKQWQQPHWLLLTSSIYYSGLQITGSWNMPSFIKPQSLPHRLAPLLAPWMLVCALSTCGVKLAPDVLPKGSRCTVTQAIAAVHSEQCVCLCNRHVSNTMHLPSIRTKAGIRLS